MPGDAIPFAWYEPVNYADWVAGGSIPPTLTNPFIEVGPWDKTPWYTEAWDGYTGPQGP